MREEAIVLPPVFVIMARMETPPWYVITGGPCTGKSTLIKELAQRGYRTVPEAARTYIETELAHGRTLADIRHDEAGFQRALLPLKVAAEQELSKEETVFFDRGMHDSIVYFAVAGVTDEPLLKEALRYSSYRTAFVLDRLPYETDHVRTEDEALAERVHALLGVAYTEAGIEVVRVPVMPVGERASFVLAHL
jgi:predicted ATPase